MYRLRRPFRRTLWIIGAVFLMAAALLVGALVATIPHFLKGAEVASEAAGQLITNPHAAADQFSSASHSFDASLAGLRELPEPAQFPSLIPPFSWYIHLNKAAVYLSRAGVAASSLAAAYPPIQASNDPGSLLAAHSAALGQLIDAHTDQLAALTTAIAQADSELSHVPSWALVTRHSELASLKTRIHELNTGLPQALSFIEEIRQALGKNDSSPHTALIIFQNDSELRPSGGFMGSYAVITGSSGVIRSFKLGTDIYTLDKNLTEDIAPPPELETISPTWAFRDSNVGAGFLPEIAPTVADFYSKEAGVTPDFLVFTNLAMLQNLLSITGPVTLPGTTTQLDHDSVGTALATYIEKDYWTTDANVAADAPKSIIGELIPVLLGKLRQTPHALQKIPGYVGQAVATKSLQMWSSNDGLESAVTNLFPSDTPPSGDWIKIVNTNLGGKKSSSNVSQDVVMTEKEQQGWENRTVTITRTHHGTGVFPDDENRNYMEIYLPPGAEVQQPPDGKGGENLLPDAIKTSYGLDNVTWPGETKRTDSWVRVGFWATTSIAEQTQFVLKYRIPDNLTTGPLQYLKQSGAEQEHLKAFTFNGEVSANLSITKHRFF